MPFGKTGMLTLQKLTPHVLTHGNRMAASREKQSAHRKKAIAAIKSSSVTLVQPDTPMADASKIREKIKVPTKSKARSALIDGEGRSMTMDID